MPQTEHSRWFADEVHPHLSSFAAYLRRSFPTLRDVDDLVQESLLRIWRAKLSRPVTSTKSFLFQIGRRLAIDALRHHAVAPTETMGDLAALPVLEERPDAAARLCYTDKVELLAAALANLPPRCREIMVLRKIEGFSLREIALRLHISEGTVQNQITRGTASCRDYLHAHGLHGFDRT